MSVIRAPFLVVALSWLVAGGPAIGAPAADFKSVAVPFLEKHCHECHGGKKTKADLDLKRFRDDRDILANHKLWRGVLQQINSGEMPPAKQPNRPSPAEITAFNDALDHSFAQAEARMPVDPGHVTIRRLNRTEYNQTVRDLLQIDFNAVENFPADDTGHGFDNIGDVLSISPVHLERYLDAADGIAQRAMVSTLPKPPSRTTSSNFLEPGGYGSESTLRRVTNSAAELFVRHELKLPGKYIFRVRAGASNAPAGDPARMTLRIGDQPVLTVSVTNRPTDWKEFLIETNLPAGEFRFSAHWDNRDTNAPEALLFVNEFKVIGPADTRTEFMKRVDAVAEGKSDAVRNRAVVEWFLTRTFRRPPTATEVSRYEQVLRAGREAGEGKWASGMQDLIRAALTSPKFLFRVEQNAHPEKSGPQPLNDFQLASRLSYFLWSTMPDEELLGLAAEGKLAGQLPAQVSRMLKDPRAVALVQNFGMQWLQLQRLQTFQPDTSLFEAFNEGLRGAMLKETELFLAEIVREDRSILDLVDADFTYVNRSLARHYGLEKVPFTQGGDRRRGGGGGSEFVRVKLPDGQRGGLLTQASILTATSNPTRTSPVKRGKWVMEQILGTPPPPPPANVPGLDGQKELKGTLRQRMEQHRSNAACANCHQQMDALGFAFENFDAIGRFRSQDAEGPIDASGTLPDGRKFSGAGELRAILKDKKELLARNVTEKLMIYALGRGLEYYDQRAIRRTLGDLAQSEYRFSALVTSIVTSDPFRLQRGKESNPASEPAKKDTTKKSTAAL